MLYYISKKGGEMILHKEFKLQHHEVIKSAIKEACIASSVMRGTSDVPAAGGIEFEVIFQQEINKGRSADFPFFACLNTDLELLTEAPGLIDWGKLGSYEEFKKKQQGSWNNESNADVIFFTHQPDETLLYYDAWSIKTTVSLDTTAAIQESTDYKKTTGSLDLVNLKDDTMSVVLRSFKDNIETKKVAGRCLLIICNNGTFSSYFWDGKVSSLCKMMKDDEFKVRTDTNKEITFGTKKHKLQCIVCSKRATVPDAKPTSFGRSLQICAAPTKKGRKANFMADMMVKSGVFEAISNGNFECKDALLKNLRKRLNFHKRRKK
jgi:hypothetical protein